MSNDGPAPTASPSRALAIAAMCAGVLLLAVSDALTKWLGARYGPLQITFARNVVALPLVIGFVLWADGRAVCTWNFLPLAEAAAMIAAVLVSVAALAGPLLGERVGPGRWAAILAGLGGG